ncbi:MAG: nucleotidyltransferase domain-containing protein [Deltaproteobacteria bacterium]|nr:nucleotidyltransferase domain-containing protein [Deltaproteobacteria bacterium]
MKPHELAKALEALYGNRLESVLLYGSAAGQDFSKKFSDYNILVVLKEPTMLGFADAAKIIRQWTRRGYSSPLFFTSDDFRRSADIFPIEYLDMKHRHQLLAGTDPLEGIIIHKHNLRHQCEFELRGKILTLKKMYLQLEHRPKKVMTAVAETLPGFVAVFRGILHLIDGTPAPSTREVIEQLATLISFQPQIFFDLLDLREGKKRVPCGHDVRSFFERYLTELTSITSYVDAFHQEVT